MAKDTYTNADLFGDDDNVISAADDNLALNKAAEAAWQISLRSPDAAAAADALGISADKAQNLDPNAVRRFAQSKANTYEANRNNRIPVTDAPQGQVTAKGVPTPDKSFYEASVGKIENNQNYLQDALASTSGADDEAGQRAHGLGYIAKVTKAVTSHDIRSLRFLPLEALTYAKQYDAKYFNTLAPDIDQMGAQGGGNIPADSNADPRVTALGQQLNQPKPSRAGPRQPRVGPMESAILNAFFDAKDRIFPDYLAKGDAQNMGLFPADDLGGAAKGPVAGIDKGKDAAGNPSFTQTPNPASLHPGGSALQQRDPFGNIVADPNKEGQGAQDYQLTNPIRFQGGQPQDAGRGTPVSQPGGPPAAPGPTTSTGPQTMMGGGPIPLKPGAPSQQQFIAQYQHSHPHASASEMRQAYYSLYANVRG